MDGDDRNCVAVVVDFDGSDGLIIINGDLLAAGRGKSLNGKWLYITFDAFVPCEDKPNVGYIHRN